MERREGPGMALAAALKKAPVIAAVREQAQLARANLSRAAVIFLLGGDPFSLPGMVKSARAAGKLIFVHLDLIDGISRDPAGVRWLSRAVSPTGILSTRPPLLRTAAEEGLSTILRIFLLDSSSLETGVRMAASCRPDLVEAMPGLLPRAIAWLGERIAPPVIAGGMLEREKDVEAALRAGALAASTSNEALWARVTKEEGRQHGKSGGFGKQGCGTGGADYEHDPVPGRGERL